VRQGGTLVPAGETEFARDASFGYSSSGLPAWVEEKTAGRVPASDVASVGLAEIREGGPGRVAEEELRTSPEHSEARTLARADANGAG
jgi:hypothetical protein